MMILYGYWRSSASYRVRIALALKEVEVEHRCVNLKAGTQLLPEHLRLNAQPFVPILELEDSTKLTQSLAIIEYLEEKFPQTPLLPSDLALRARVRAAAHIIAADISPIQNLRLLNYIRAEYAQDDTGVKSWAAHWIVEGFKALERLAQDRDTQFFLTDAPGCFECCLIPQVYNARRFGVDMAEFPNLVQIDKICQNLPAFKQSAPENQGDAPD